MKYAELDNLFIDIQFNNYTKKKNLSKTIKYKIFSSP